MAREDLGAAGQGGIIQFLHPKHPNPVLENKKTCLEARFFGQNYEPDYDQMYFCCDRDDPQPQRIPSYARV